MVDEDPKQEIRKVKGDLSDEDPLFVLVARLAERDGVTPLNARPGCWHRKVDESWELWVNSHQEPILGGPREDIPILAFHCYVEFNGWPAGCFNPFDGWFAAGKLANQETFESALRKAISQEEGRNETGK